MGTGGRQGPFPEGRAGYRLRREPCSPWGLCDHPLRDAGGPRAGPLPPAGTDRQPDDRRPRYRRPGRRRLRVPTHLRGRVVGPLRAALRRQSRDNSRRDRDRGVLEPGNDTALPCRRPEPALYRLPIAPRLRPGRTLDRGGHGAARARPVLGPARALADARPTRCRGPPRRRLRRGRQRHAGGTDVDHARDRVRVCPRRSYLRGGRRVDPARAGAHPGPGRECGRRAAGCRPSDGGGWMLRLRPPSPRGVRGSRPSRCGRAARVPRPPRPGGGGLMGGWSGGEMMAVAASHLVADDDVVLVGIGLPQVAAALAQRTHAPNARLLLELGVFDPQPVGESMGIADPRMWTDSKAYAGMLEVLGYMLQGGRVSLGLLGALQVDQFGSINSSLVVEADGSRRRFRGSGGGNDVASAAGRVLVVVRHEPRKFKAAVDFVTSPGRRVRGAGRAELGLDRKSTRLNSSHLGISYA